MNITRTCVSRHISREVEFCGRGEGGDAIKE